MLRLLFLRSGVILALVVVCLTPVAHAQYPGYITSSNDTGMPSYGSYISSNIDSVNLTNGNLIIRIPTFALDGRGVGIKSWMEYDSKFWAVTTTVITHFQQQPVTHFSWHVDSSTGGWRGLSNGSGGVGWTEQTYNCPPWPQSYSTPGKTTIRSNYFYTSPDGSRHSIPLINVFQTVPGAVCEPGSTTNPYPNLVAYTDGGHTKVDITLDQLLDHTHITIVRQDGTLDGGPNTAFSRKDTNGNFCCAYGTTPQGTYYTIDTLGRPTSDTGGSASYYDSNGNLHPAPAEGGFVSLALSPSFPTTSYDDQHVVDPYNGRHLSTFTNFTLPNGLAYTFSYDDPNNPGHPNPYGEITKITLPTGGYIKYKYATFALMDPGPTDPLDGTIYYLDSRRVVQRIVSADGTVASEKIWTYAYSYIGTTTVTDPLGNYEVHGIGQPGSCAGTSFNAYAPAPYIDGGASYYDSTGNLLKTVNTSYQCDGGPVYAAQPNRNIPNTSSFTVGLRNIRPIATTTTLGGTNQVSETDTVYGDCFNYYFSTDNMQRTDCRDNPTQTLEYDYGVGSKGALLRSTTYTYLHNSNSAYLNANITNRVTQKTIFDGNSNQVASTQYGYDGTAITRTDSNPVPQHDYTNYLYSNTVRGNVTSISRWLSTTNSWLTSLNYYNDVGNLVQTTDPGNHSYYLSYSDNFTDASKNGNTQGYLTSVTSPTTVNGVPHIEGKQYFYYTGLTAAVCGQNAPNPAACVNSLSPTLLAPVADYAKYTFDLLGRPLTVLHGDGGSTSFTFSDLTSTSTPITVSSSSAIDPSQNLVNTAMTDGLGRVTQTQLNSDPDGTDFVDTVYDAAGRVSTASNPHRSGSAPTDGITTNVYDGLGRTVKVIPPDGSTSANNVTTSYSGNCVIVTDQAGKSRKSCNDGLGRLIRVLEDPSSSNFETDYTYDALDNLTCIEQHGTATGQTGCSSSPSNDANSAWRIRRFTYDSLLRLVTAKNPESGTISYTYDSDGDVLTKYDARGITTTMTYDQLHRVLTKTYSDGTPTATYIYDVAATDGPGSSANPIGRLVEVRNSNATEVDSYNSRGHIAAQWQCTPLNCGSSWFNLAYQYNYVGGLLSESTPMGFALTSAYDSAARLKTLTSSWSDAQHPATLLSVDQSVGYAPAGALAKMTYGNGLVETGAYNSRLQPTQLRTYNPTTNTDILNLNYGFSDSTGTNNGNVMTFNSTATQIFMRNYTYDPLNRLSTMSSPADASGCYGLTWTYDAWGNRLSQLNTGGSGSYCIGSQPTIFTNNRIVDTGFGYDSAGNMTSSPNPNASGTLSYAFDAENRITSVNAGGVASYIYDAEGQRVRKISNGVTTDYVYDGASVVAEIQGSTWTTGYVHSGEALVVQYNGSIGTTGATTLFAHSDHLGSTRLMTTVSAGVSDSMDYLPYGELLAGGTSTTHKFTGKERDSESGLDNFSARYTSSSLGRFASPDPLLNSGRPDNPQSWNRYTYTLNNPLNFSDPTGLYVWSAGLGGNAADGVVSADIVDKRKHFRAALADAYSDANNLNDFDQWADAIKALDSYGQENVANGVTVAVDTVPNDQGAFTQVQDDNQVVVAIAPGTFKSQSLPEIVGHEGKHVEDAKAWTGCGRCAAKNPSTFDFETAGYEIAGLIAAGHFKRLNMNATYNVNAGSGSGPRKQMPIWNASWGKVDDSRGRIKIAAEIVVTMNGDGANTDAGKRPAFPGAGKWQ